MKKISDLFEGENFKFFFDGSLTYTYEGPAGTIQCADRDKFPHHNGTQLHWARLPDGVQTLLPDFLEVISLAKPLDAGRIFLFQHNEYYKWYSDDFTKTIIIPGYTCYLVESLKWEGPESETNFHYWLIKEGVGIKQKDGKYTGEVVIAFCKTAEGFQSTLKEYLADTTNFNR